MRATPALSVSLLAMIVACASLPASAQQAGTDKGPSLFQRYIRPGVTYENYLSQVFSPFRQASRGKQVLDRAAIEEAKAASDRQAENSGIMTYIVMDLNRDGVVTVEEIRTALDEQMGLRKMQETSGNAARLAQIETRVTQLMRADANGNGSIELSEMRTAGLALGANRPNNDQASGYLALGNGKELTSTDLLRLAKAAFEAVDKDGDTIVSEDEFRGFGERNVAGVRQERPADRRRPEPVSQDVPGCEIPPPGNDEKVVFFGTYEGTGQSSVTLGDPNQETRTAAIKVESGNEPLYVVLSSFRPMVWRFEGEVGRVKSVVLTSVHGRGGILPAGVTGLPKERVVFTHPGACIQMSYKVDSIEGAVTKGVLTRLLGRAPGAMSGSYGVESLSIPSMEVEMPGKVARPSPPDGVPAMEWGNALRFTPTGLVPIDPKDVRSNGGKVETYDVLPGRMGVAQLVGRGDLKALGGEQYKIVRPIPRFPAELNGAHSVKFLLGTGVPMPSGSPGHSCVISEETGTPIGQSMTCR